MWHRLRQNHWFVLIFGTILGLPISAAIAVLMAVAVVFIILKFLTPTGP
jgi:hypothetical protein